MDVKVDVKITITMDELKKMAADAARAYAPDIQPHDFQPVYDTYGENCIGLEANRKGDP